MGKQERQTSTTKTQKTERPVKHSKETQTLTAKETLNCIQQEKLENNGQLDEVFDIFGATVNFFMQKKVDTNEYHLRISFDNVAELHPTKKTFRYYGEKYVLPSIYCNSEIKSPDDLFKIRDEYVTKLIQRESFDKLMVEFMTKQNGCRTIIENCVQCSRYVANNFCIDCGKPICQICILKKIENEKYVCLCEAEYKHSPDAYYTSDLY